MPNLNCSVTECGHNAHGLCNLQHVRIAGSGMLADTCWVSFTALKDLSFLGGTNAVADLEVRPETGVECDAENCHYNFSRCCSADRIKVVAPCTPEDCGYTKCATFKRK